MAEGGEDYCAAQVRRLDHDRYLTALFAPAADRAALLALYAFNTEISRVRASVSEPLIGQIRLQWWRDAIAEAAAGRPRRHPVVEGLRGVLARGATPADFEPLLAARERDLSDDPPETLAALVEYADGSAGQLCRLAVRLLSGRDEAADAAEAAAKESGIAWALVGTLRSVPFLARERRTRLPSDLVAAERLDLDAMYEGRPGDALARVAAALAAEAGRHLEAARVRRRAIARRTHAALLCATLADFHLNRMRRRGFALFDPALRRPGGEAWRLTLAALRGRY